jgi:RNA polymerase primary sigma factor
VTNLADQSSDDTLSEREAGVDFMRLGQRKPLAEILRAFGVTEERIRQIESKAMSKILHGAG